MHTLPKKALLGVFLVLIVVFSLFAGGQASTSQPVLPAPSDGFPLEVVDDLGSSVLLDRKPETIVSLSLFSDEILLEMLPASRFAAITSLAQSPVYSNVAQKAQGISPVIEFNTETIISLYPDLVIAANWSEADKIAQLRQAGIQVYQIDTPFNIEGVRRGIERLGTLTGEPEAARNLIASMDSRLDSLTNVIATIPQNERLTALDYNTWGTANGGDTTWNLVLNLAGITNAVAHLEAGDFGQVPLSKEVLVDLDPDLLFLPGYIWGEDDGAQAFYDQVRNDPALTGLKAITNDALFIFPERLKGTYSHYLVEAAEHAARIAYPQLF